MHGTTANASRVTTVPSPQRMQYPQSTVTALTLDDVTGRDVHSVTPSPTTSNVTGLPAAAISSVTSSFNATPNSKSEYFLSRVKRANAYGSLAACTTQPRGDSYDTRDGTECAQRRNYCATKLEHRAMTPTHEPSTHTTHACKHQRKHRRASKPAKKNDRVAVGGVPKRCQHQHRRRRRRHSVAACRSRCCCPCLRSTRACSSRRCTCTRHSSTDRRPPR
jgi:hypothetical protein